MGLLKSQSATEVKKWNYVSSYSLVDNKVIKQQEKIVAVFFEEWNKKKVLWLIKNKFPELEKYIISNFPK